MDPQELDKEIKLLVARASLKGFNLSEKVRSFGCGYMKGDMNKGWIIGNSIEYNYTLALPYRFFKPNVCYKWITYKYVAACCKEISTPYMVAALDMEQDENLIFVEEFTRIGNGMVSI